MAAPTTAELGATAPSVVRTGTGSLDLIAGGSFNEESLYGIYTAGTQSADVGANGSDPYNESRGEATNGGGTVLGTANAAANAAIADYEAYYPTDGGNVLIDVQGNLISDFSPSFHLPSGSSTADSGFVGSWLWHQGGGTAVDQPAAWWINFGTYTWDGYDTPILTGFTGIGALGGGNMTINVGGNAGTTSTSADTGLNVAIGSTGRVLANGTLEETGGGNLVVNIAGNLNSFVGSNGGLNDDNSGTFTDLRGNITITAGAIGTIMPNYGTAASGDPRTIPLTTAEVAGSYGGIIVVPGDGTVIVSTDGTLVFGGVSDATRMSQLNTPPFSVGGTTFTGGGTDGFSLWTDATAITLFSAGGNLTPNNAAIAAGSNDASLDGGHLFYPPTLDIIAASGSIYFQSGGPVELMPAPAGELNILAMGSIYNAAVDISGADPSLIATPFDPAFYYSYYVPATRQTVVLSDVSLDTYAGQQGTGQLLAFGPDTPTGNLHADDDDPVRIYAATGDIVDLQFGEEITFNPVLSAVTPSTWYVGAKLADIIAVGDIISSGMPYTQSQIADFSNAANSTPGFILNDSATDISVLSAGRDILYTSLQVGGPGLLLVQAGGNLYEANKGAFQSVGLLFGTNAQNQDSGAGITLLAGVGTNGPDYAAFANAYLNPADPSALLASGMSDYGTIVQENDAELVTWLHDRFGYGGGVDGAWAYFQTLAAEQQDIFLRQIYFQELNEGGLDYNDPSSLHYLSYVRGRDAIATLFPSSGTYSGSLSMFGNVGIRTDFGGTIQTLVPGGETIVGMDATNPAAAPEAGVITQGSGDIDMYSLESVLVGESRIMTTFGGNIVIWSAEGDINAGRGPKSTVVYQPPRIAYDDWGNITLAPTAPSTGAGIATLAPIAGVPAGNINLVAPLGTVDAGEAGIRVSGNFNVAALHVINVANIVVQGATTGVPIAATPNVGALTAASNTAGAASAAADQAARNSRQTGPRAQDLPSIITIEVIGYGGVGSDEDGDQKRKQQEDERRRSQDRQSNNDPRNGGDYNDRSAVQIAGYGKLSETEAQILTQEERRKLNGR